ncbi:hypothetical protein BDZ88DRAFT_231645 [Geranomyces variabilis]|nr:hypothetical protein BDZ88DRAFT_231645 [Geranomyces variabilis]KAJ3135897.1 hypothetical protein HDU90_003638 [Geranomyces variabilis]
MNNLGSYLAAKVAQSKASGGTPPSRRATPAPQQHHRAATPPSPTPSASTTTTTTSIYRQDTNNPTTPLSKRSTSIASGLSTAGSSSAVARSAGPLATSPTPTTADSSPVFSPLRGLWGTPGVSPNKPKSINDGGGGAGLLDGFAFEFESLDPGIAFGVGGGGGDGAKCGSRRGSGVAGFSDAFRASSRVEESRNGTLDEVSREGWLWTQSGHTWTKMYAALSGERGAGSRSTGAQIQLYENESNSHALRIISLTACTGVCPAAPRNTNSSQPAFRLVMRDSHGLLFASDSRAERDRWVSSLTAIVGEADEDDQDEDEDREEEEEESIMADDDRHHNFRNVTPRPVPSAPAFEQVAETGFYARRNSDSATGAVQQHQHRVGGAGSSLFGNRPAQPQSTPSSGTVTGVRAAAASDLHAELSNVKDLVLRLLDAQIVAGDPGAGFDILREELTTAAGSIKEAARGIVQAGEQIGSRQRDNNATAAAAAAPPSAELEAAVSELTESMEMRTSKIAKMVHELLTQTKANSTTVANTDHAALKPWLDSLGQQMSQLLTQRDAQPETSALDDLQKTLKKVAEKLDTRDSLGYAITDLAEQTSGLSAAQQQAAVDMGQLMTMIAAGNQRSTSAWNAGLQTLSAEIQSTLAKRLNDITSASTAKINEQLEAKTADIKAAIATTITTRDKHADFALDPMMELLVDIRDRLAATPAAPGRAGSGTGDRLDRPTTNMITAINDKLIHLSRVVDHVQATQTARFSSLDTALAAVGGGAAGNDDESEAAQMIQLHKLTDIGEGVAGLADRVARAGREAQTRHDVVDGRLDRIADQLKHMHRTVTKLVQVGMLGADANEAGSAGDVVSVSGGPGGASGVAAALAEQRSVLGRMREDLGEIKEQLADDVTGARLADLLAMFAISQDTHSVVADKVSRIEALGKTSAGAVQELQDKLKIAATAHASNETATADADAHALLQQVAAQIEKLGSAPSQNSAHKLIESIHSCLVSYLPIDLDSRLSSIQTSLGAISRSTSPIRGGGALSDPWLSSASASAASSSSPQDLRELLACYHESAQREHASAAALDSIQHSLARVLDCFDAHGLFQRTSSVPVPVSVPATTMPAVAARLTDVTEFKELRDAVMEIRNATAGRETVREELAMLVGKRNALREEITALQAQKTELKTVGGSGGQRGPKFGFVEMGSACRRISCPPGIPIAPAIEK